MKTLIRANGQWYATAHTHHSQAPLKVTSKDLSLIISWLIAH